MKACFDEVAFAFELDATGGGPVFFRQSRIPRQTQIHPERARWISDEHWHSEQTGRWPDDGSYELTIPFNDHSELLMDILKHVRHVEILEPEFLREAI